MIKKADVVAILDEARNGEYEALYVLLSTFVRNRDPNKDDIVIESLFTIHKKLAAGGLSIALAPQLSGIVRKHGLRIYERESKAREALLPGGDEQLERYGDVESTDPAELLVRAELVRERIVALREIKDSQPRQFAILVARYLGIADEEYLESLGEDISSDALRQLRARTKKTITKTMEKIRKGPKP